MSDFAIPDNNSEDELTIDELKDILGDILEAGWELYDELEILYNGKANEKMLKWSRLASGERKV